jgi:hypothetical protein
MLDLFRKPFDARFAALMDRLCSHEALFNSEMQLEESRFLEMQFVKHDSDLGAATDFMENIQIQMDELRESNRAREAAQADAYVKLDSRLREISEKLGREGTDSVLESKLLSKIQHSALI